VTPDGEQKMMTDKKRSEDKSLEIDNLDSKRGDFVETFFRKGAEFTSKLIGELESLQRESERLKLENAELKHHLASEEAIRELMQKIDKLEAEKKKLNLSVQHENEKFVNYQMRYAEVEKELDMMANLYVALSQLHSKFEPSEMLGVIEQLLAQFVGAGSFVIYLRRNVGEECHLVPVHAYHCDDPAECIPWNDGPVGEAAATQLHSVADSSRRENGDPLACIPMVFGGDTIGVIAILEFFEQKKQFEAIDFEFFKLLATHSASAIVAAGLMVNADSMGTGLEQYERL
jgi:hypothetical protein